MQGLPAFQVDKGRYFSKVLKVATGESSPDMDNKVHEDQVGRVLHLAGSLGFVQDGVLADSESRRMLEYLKKPMDAPDGVASMVDQILENAPDDLVEGRSRRHSSSGVESMNHMGGHDDHFSSVIEGDLPPWSRDASGHIMDHGNGSTLNTFEQDNIAATIRGDGGSLPADIESVVESLDEVGVYNPGQPPEKKVAGVEGDGAQVRQILAENGGDAKGLTDQQLVDLWGANEHHHLHAVLFGNPEVYNPIHMTSLNDRDQLAETSGDAGTLGGFNDKGDFPQWGWFDDAQGFQELFDGSSGNGFGNSSAPSSSN